MVGLGPVRAPCRVVSVVDEENRRGFAYGTLPGHPESGEELFAVRYDPADDTVYAEVVAFSRHATWWSKAAGPITSMVQRMMTKRYLCRGVTNARRTAWRPRTFSPWTTPSKHTPRTAASRRSCARCTTGQRPTPTR